MAEMKGFGLEVDVLKKIEHQLARLKTQAARERALEFVSKAVSEGLAAAKPATTNGTADTIPAPGNQVTLEEHLEKETVFGE